MTDGINAHEVVWHGVPNPADWPITKRLDGVEFSDRDETTGVRPITNADTWPGVIPAGWDGPVTYSLWLIRRIGSRWHGSCAIEFFQGRYWTGAPLGRYYSDWYSPDRESFGPLRSLPNVVESELIAFMVAAGSHRLKDTSVQPGQQSVRERSPIIVLPYTANGVVRAAAPTPDPRPDPRPEPQPDPRPDPSLAEHVTALRAEQGVLRESVNGLTVSDATRAQEVAELRARIAELEARPTPTPPKTVSFRVFGVPLTVPVTWGGPAL